MPRTPRFELIELRLKKFPDMMQRDFAEKKLGITRLHMTSIEMGRRLPSMALAARWIEALAPEARIKMFGPLPEVTRRIREIRRLQKVAPEIFSAA
jgi:DNA-binding XRE family transcriptional regulator